MTAEKGTTSTSIRSCLRILHLATLLTSVSSSFVVGADRKLQSAPPVTSTTASCTSGPAQMAAKSSVRASVALTSYEKLLCRLFTTNLFHAKTKDLKTMDRLHRALGSPMNAGRHPRQIVHIAGSNGKGSVALKIARTLRHGRYRVGLFGSPHISSFRERIQINEEPVSEEQVRTHLARIFDLCDAQRIPATFFEVVTALSFAIFAEERVDVVVLETGLGGRLDATNIVRRPALAVITSIGLEHTQILGDTVEKIALEKGGIIKTGCPVLVGPRVPTEVLRQCAAEKNASHFYECASLLGKDATPDASHDYDAENSRIATAALTLLQTILKDDAAAKINPANDISTQQIARGVKARPMCRFEELVIDVPGSNNESINVVLDVAHNPQAIECLIAKLRFRHPSSEMRFVVGMSADKDVKTCSDILLENAHPNNIHLMESPNPRAASTAFMLEANPRLRACHHQTSSIARQVREAMKLAAANNEVLVICGSFFVMADARKELGIQEPRDSAVIGEEVARIIESRQKDADQNYE